jgi:hypothetical protein
MAMTAFNKILEEKNLLQQKLSNQITEQKLFNGLLGMCLVIYLGSCVYHEILVQKDKSTRPKTPFKKFLESLPLILMFVFSISVLSHLITKNIFAECSFEILSFTLTVFHLKILYGFLSFLSGFLLFGPLRKLKKLDGDKPTKPVEVDIVIDETEKPSRPNEDF